MMNNDIIFDDFSQNTALWCGGDMEQGELARAVEYVLENKMHMISVPAEVVKVVWPWLEQTDVKIVSRFYLTGNKISEKQISDATININNVFKQGANGAQVFLRNAGLGELVEQTHVIRDDLFFDKDLIIGLDIADVEPCDWESVYEKLRKINASALMLVLTRDMGIKSDFLGRFFGAMNAWNPGNNFDLHFMLGNNPMRIEQVMRIAKQTKPHLLKNMRFFVNY
ncbi:MAG: hypothetical protein IKW57_03210 [Alphaproteobacteria bacterium]|nr:hypothetical protein [Alphaproteobacteria bacterium]